MTDYSSRFRAANIQQLQQVCALLCEGHRKYLVSLFDEFPEGEHLPVEWPHQVFDKRLDAILSAPVDTDEKPLPPVNPDRVIRSGDLVVGKRYRVVEIASFDTSPFVEPGCIAECTSEENLAGYPHRIYFRQRNELGKGFCWFVSGDGGTWVTAVELVEDEAEKPKLVASDLYDGAMMTQTHVPQKPNVAMRSVSDPAIIRASDGVVLEPGWYESKTFGRFRVNKPLLPRKHPGLGIWEWNVMSNCYSSTVRRVEPQATQESPQPASAEASLISTPSRGQHPSCGPAGEAQPEGKCARCKGERSILIEQGRIKCPDCKGTGRARLEDGKLTDAPGPVRMPDRYQEAIASRYAGGDTIRELAADYNMREDLVLRAIRVTLGYLLEQHPKLTDENASLRERLEAAERDRDHHHKFRGLERARAEKAERECAELQRRAASNVHKEELRALRGSLATLIGGDYDPLISNEGLVSALTEKLAIYEREAKAWEAIERWLDGDDEKDVHIGPSAVYVGWTVRLCVARNHAPLFTAESGGTRVAELERAAVWCESQLNKESE